MTKRLRVFSIVVFMLFLLGGTATALGTNYVKVIDNGTESTYYTSAETVQELFDENNIVTGREDFISKPLSAGLEKTDMITIERAIPVIINVDGVPRLVSTREKTVGGLLDSMNKKIDQEYVVENVTESTNLNSNMVINLTSNIRKLFTKTESVPFETEIRENASMAYGTEKIVQEGSEGVVEITMEEIYTGNELTSTNELNRATVKTPVNAIIEKGTAKQVETKEVGSVAYQKAINVTATGYTPHDPGCTGITSTGVPAKRGLIAVDPRVIPMGTKLFIPGYGEAIAADTGGKIKGNRIDLCYDTTAEAFQWGVRDVTIYVLD